MGRLIGQSFWLTLPVILTAILHMFVVKANLWRRLAVPLDGGRSWGRARLFGDHKTWRGVVVMVVGAALCGAVQALLGGSWAAAGFAPVDYGRAGAAVAPAGSFLALVLGYTAVGAAGGLGYALGELPNSFIKRRLEITPGKTGAGGVGVFFFLLDQADSVIGTLALMLVVVSFGLRFALVAFVALTLLHLVLNGALFLTRVRRNL